MSAPVPLDVLADAIGRYGPIALVVTVGDDGRPHTVSATVSLEGGELVAEVGRTSAGNAIAHPHVTLVWAPVESDPDHLLVVDGDARVTGTDDPDHRGILRVQAVGAVQHRHAGVDPSVPSCIRLGE